MIENDTKIKSLASLGDITELAEYISSSYPMKTICEDYAALLINTSKMHNDKPIVVSEEDFQRIQSLFKVRGYTISGDKETRGRKAKTKGQNNE